MNTMKNLFLVGTPSIQYTVVGAGGGLCDLAPTNAPCIGNML